MRTSDCEVFSYRAEKARRNVDAVICERLHGRFTKGTVRTDTAGYIDFSVYRPCDAGSEALPAVFSFHGGGFVLGFYETDGPYCQRLADTTGCAVVNVDYALAPEFKYPAPILSSYEAVVGILAQAETYGLDPAHVMACGHSAGGCIAACLCLIDRDRHQVGFCGQILDYAPLKQTASEEHRHALDAAKAISHERVLQYLSWYFERSDQLDEPLASPLNADLHELPPMLVIAAEYDSLSGEEQAYAQKAERAGVPVHFELFRGCQHGFTHQELKEYRPEDAERAWNLMASFIRDRMGAEV